MKIRNGFVSNSSSASFIIRWKLYGNNDEALDYCLGMLFYDNDELKTEITNNTRREENSFLTTFRTSMYNDMSDFKDAALFLVALTMDRDKRFEVVSANINCD